MAKTDLTTIRKTLDEICEVPDKIISVYALEQHVWADENSDEARKARKPELKTIEEFQIDPVRPFLNEFFRNVAAPYRPERKDEHIGQGYWIQAEFGSGKSHLLCFLAALSLGNKDSWAMVQQKEQEAGRGKRESLYRFWEDGLQAKNTTGKKGLFVVVKTLVGVGGGTIGFNDSGKKLTDYILDAAREQMRVETGKNISLYPSEILADRFLKKDLGRYHADLKKFLHDPRFFEEDEFEDINDFIQDIQENKTPEHKKNCGEKLWQFYDEYLEIQPNIERETEDVLKHMVEAIMAEGYSGVLILLDEVSLFMKNRTDQERVDDEKTLVVLSNRLAKVYNLPVWTVCSAQQALENLMSVKNIIADDRLKLVKLLEDERGYYDIVLSRVRKIKDKEAIGPYYLYYKRGFTWPASIGQDEFEKFFPFHKPGLEVLRNITYELTTTRSAIHFMHQTLKHQVKNKGNEIIRLWELFDETVEYVEDPSGTHSGLVAIKTKKEHEYRVYENCKNHIDSLTKGYLKTYQSKAVKTLQTLFLYYVSRTKMQGLTPEDISNSVMIERASDSTPDENIQHYEMMAVNLKKDLRQILESFDEDNKPHYRFEPDVQGLDPQELFTKAHDDAESNEKMRKEAWEHLIALDDWNVKSRGTTLELSHGLKSIFYEIAPFSLPWKETQTGDIDAYIDWLNREIKGKVGMRDFVSIANEKRQLPALDTENTDEDFAVFVGTRPASEQAINKILDKSKDPRVILWTPTELTLEEHDRLLDFAAYRKLVVEYQGKETDEAKSILEWVNDRLRTDMGKIKKIVDNSYARGRIDAINNSKIDFHVAGELVAIITPAVQRVLSSTYESRDIKFDGNIVFTKEDGIKVINGVVRSGFLPKGKTDKDISAAQNFGYGLKIMKKSAERKVDWSDNAHVKDLLAFINEKLADDGQSMKMETIYKNFMGVGGPKNYGLTRRMIQIFLLCLAQNGQIRIELSGRSGIAAQYIEYSNISGIYFNTKLLDSFINVQKMAKPENWEVLRPYAEKLLNKPIPTNADKSEIIGFRSELHKKFEEEKDNSKWIKDKAKLLFGSINAHNPYENEVSQVERFFQIDLLDSNDISQILYGLKEAFGYKAFDDGTSGIEEVDDFALRLKNYNGIAKLLNFESEIKAAYIYANYSMPDSMDLSKARGQQSELLKKMGDLQPYIDSDIKLKTELVGENSSLQSLIREYGIVYTVLHDHVCEKCENEKNRIIQLQNGREMEALKLLEKLSAIKPEVSKTLDDKLVILNDSIFTCVSPSKASLENHLKVSPEHECGLSFANAQQIMDTASCIADEAECLFNDTLNKKLEIFLNPTVRLNLSAGKNEKIILDILKCENIADVRNCLVNACLADPDIIEIIGKYMKQITVRPLKISGFRPSINTIERGQVDQVVDEFRQFIVTEFDGQGNDGEGHTMIKLE